MPARKHGGRDRLGRFSDPIDELVPRLAVQQHQIDQIREPRVSMRSFAGRRLRCQTALQRLTNERLSKGALSEKASTSSSNR